MEQEYTKSTLAADKALMESILSKEALTQFDACIQEVPEAYFDQFSGSILDKIKTTKKAGIAKLFSISSMSIAAAVLLIIAGSYFLVQKSKVFNEQIAVMAIHEIPIAEMDAYVSNNEWIAEMDVQNEINKMETNFETSALPKDSID